MNTDALAAEAAPIMAHEAEACDLLTEAPQSPRGGYDPTLDALMSAVADDSRRVERAVRELTVQARNARVSARIRLDLMRERIAFLEDASDPEPCNGWVNWDTWNVVAAIDNVQSSLERVSDAARSMGSSTFAAWLLEQLRTAALPDVSAEVDAMRVDTEEIRRNYCEVDA